MNTDNKSIDFIEIQTGLDPQFSIIWLHGLGADGHDFESIVPELGLPADKPVRFVFPHAPVRPITINNGMSMRGWYDVYDFPVGAGEKPRVDRDGLEGSMAIVMSLVEQENARGIATENIFLAGFSQGGVMSLFAGLRMKERLAGIIALSCYLPDPESLPQESSTENHNTPIFMAHGNQDEIIPVSAGFKSYEILKEMGFSVDWRTYNMPHSVHPDEISDIAGFIKNQMD